MVTKRLSLSETPLQNLLTARAKLLLHPSKHYYKVEVPWCYCNSNMKTVQKINKDKLFNENLISQWQNEKCQILHNGQVRFFMASALQKWPNFSKLAMKWPIWQPWHRRLSAVNSRKRNIESSCVDCCSLLCN